MTEEEKINGKLIYIYLVICISVFQSGVDFQMSMFLYYSPEHKCQVPNRSDITITLDNCYYYKNESFPVKNSCTTWAFDKSKIKSTIVTEFLLVCDRKYLQLILIPIKTLPGIFIFCFGLFSDMKGRKLSFLFCVFMDSIIWILMGLIPTYIGHVILRTLKIVGTASSIIGLVLAYELTPQKYRNFIAINYWLFFSIGISISPLYVAFSSTWRNAWLIASWPMIFYAFAPFIIIESPTWLMANKRFDEATRNLSILGQYSIFQDSKELSQTQSESNYWQNFKDFCKSKLLIVRLIVLLLTSLSFSLAYQGTSTNIEFAITNIYINAAIMGLLEIPACFLGYLSYLYIGSVRSVVIWTLIGVTSYAIIPENWDNSFKTTTFGTVSHLILAVVAKFFLVLSWNVIYCFYACLFPTNSRNLVSTLGEMVGYVGAGLGGFLGYYYAETMYNSNISTSNMIYGGVLIFSVLLWIIIIPSINKTSLPNTIEEAEAIQKLDSCLFTKSDND